MENVIWFLKRSIELDNSKTQNLNSFYFKELVSGITNACSDTNAVIESISRDSRNVQKNSLFVACRGKANNGDDYIGSAIKNGAVAVVMEGEKPIAENIALAQVDDSMKAWGKISEKWFGSPCRKINMFGVTGTNGKTTITYILEKIFLADSRKTGVIGTVEYRCPSFVRDAQRTTPDAYDLQELLSDMSQENVDTVAMEVSSHALDQQRIVGCEFASVIFTNLTPEHLDYHSNMNDYFASKTKLFSQDYLKTNGFAIINIDDEYGKKIADSAKVKNVSTYGLKSNADVFVRELEYNSDGIEMFVSAGQSEMKIKSKLIGEFNVYNILASIASAKAFGISDDVIVKGIANLEHVPGRAELIRNDRELTIIVDYAHTPDALQNIISNFRSLTHGKLITVFGCGGDRDKQKRPVMGEIASELSDLIVIADDNPRNEKPEKIREEIYRGVSNDNLKKVKNVGDRKKAIKYALEKARPGDVLIVAGKGHETYQEAKGKRIQFDDKIIIKEILGNK